MSEWPLSTEEKAAIRSKLSQKFSMVDIIGRYSARIEDAASSTFTHKGICPNKDHKQGGERTPSFFFSETDKTFMCFGCNIRGDIFDFLALMLKQPAQTLVDNYVKNKNCDIQQILLNSNIRPSIDLFGIKHKLYISIREHTEIFRNDTSSYEDECRWADMMFKKIDDRFSKMDKLNFQQAKYFSMQIYMELDRRKTEKV